MRRDATTQRVFDGALARLHAQTSRMFFWLLLVQWLAAVAAVLVLSPRTWAGNASAVHVHVKLALVGGGLTTLVPLVLLRLQPAWWLTRHVVAVAQLAWSGMLIHLFGGRIETHFHIFGSLAFIAFYRDWRALVTATAVVATDHLVRGLVYPESVYGIANPEWWRFLEHAAWISFEGVVLVLGARYALREMWQMADRSVALARANEAVERQVDERTAELAQTAERYRSLIENTNAIPFEYDLATCRMTYVAPQGLRSLGNDEAVLRSTDFFWGLVAPVDRDRVAQLLTRALRGEDPPSGHFDLRLERSDGTTLDLRLFLSPYVPGQRLRGIALDVTHQKKLEAELSQAQKLESVGRLASGVAHEINTPVQFVSDSVHFVQDAAVDLFALVDKLRAVRQAVRDGQAANDAVLAADRAEEASDLEYLRENVPRALARSIDGLGRVATIVRSMKEFAHPDSTEMVDLDLNRALESTLTIARNEYKYVADVVTDFGPLPPLRCYPGEINQALLNVIVNAAHAIADVVAGTERRGTITVKTRAIDGSVEVRIADTGTGIPPEARGRLFDPFFTTKPVGRGTGQGLPIVRSVVVDRHGGTVDFTSEVGRGTEFVLRLPLEHAAQEAA